MKTHWALREENVDAVRTLANEFGTPLFLLDDDLLRRQAMTVSNGLSLRGFDTSLYYSVKTNYLPYVVKKMVSYGLGLDVVSRHELDLAVEAGARGDRLVFNGPVKLEEEIRLVVENGGMVNIDSISDVDALRACLVDGLKPRAGVRLSPGLNVYPSHDDSWNENAQIASSQSRFGWPISSPATLDLLASISDSGLTISGLHMHLGSQITDVNRFIDACSKVVNFAVEHVGTEPVEIINFGGGMGVPGLARSHLGPAGKMQLHTCRTSEQLAFPSEGFDLDLFSERLEEVLTTSGLRKVAVGFEPGRIIVSNPIILVSRVCSIKEAAGRRWLILDCGLNLMPTFAMGERRNITLLEHNTSASSADSRASMSYSISGPLCYEGDVLSHGQLLPSGIEIGDYLLIEDAGAYTVSRSTNFIRPRAAVCVVGGPSSPWICWERETTQDVYSFAREEHERKFS